MKAPSPAFSYYPKDIMSDEDCAAMTLEEFGAYHRLLCHAWLEGSIPKDKTKLARLIGVGRKKLDKLWPAIEPCWGASENDVERLIQRRLDAERRKQLTRSEEQSQRGRMGGRPCKSTKEQSDCLNNDNPTVTRTKPEKSLPSPSPSPTAKEQKRTSSAGAPGRTTWLTPYGLAWERRWGVGSVPPWGEMAKTFQDPHERIGEADLGGRWVRFLASADKPRFARPTTFVQEIGQWAAPTELPRAPIPKPSVLDRDGRPATADELAIIRAGREA